MAFAVLGYPASHDLVTAQQTRPSFVIDYDEPSVTQARAEALRLCGPSPKPDQLALFVGRYIDKKDMLRGFDLASQVARRREGDCTEHAVLLAALARSFGIPARVVTGMALVSVEGKIEAVGHAWTEVYQSGRWKLVDAAIGPQIGARYLPMQVMDDEGPAFARRMVERPNPILIVRRIVIDEPPPALRP
jgi:transglutaminase-like putative cysteine protease